MSNTSFRSQHVTDLGAEAENWIQYLAAREGTDPEQQRRFTGKSGVEAFDEALSTVDSILAHADTLGVQVTPTSRLLDFGCGWGRITKTASRYFEPANITSADVYQGALDLVKASGFPVELVKGEPEPPLPLEDGQYDFIFAYSVFSHLKEEKALAWMQEFRRLLKPGGLVGVTTRARGFINWTAKLRENQKDLPAHARGSDVAFVDTDDALRRYDAGEFVFDQERTSGPLKDVGYGEACIPKAYVERVWAPQFDKVLFVPAHEAKTNQSLIFCRK